MNNLKEKICFLIGNPVKHSLSPGMHRIAFKKYGMENWDYKLKKIETEREFKDFIKRIIEKGYPGFNVTIPHKIKIMDHLDTVSKTAREIGAVNTVKNEAGKLIGYNTDHMGFREDLKDTLDFRTELMEKESAMVLGAGGAGRVVGWVLLSIFKKVYIYDIDIQKAESLKQEYADIYPHKEIVLIDKNNVGKPLKDISLLVNATPVGMKKGPPPVNLKSGQVRATLKVYDVVYNRNTELIKQAHSLGLRAANGVGMLAGQGAEAFHIWTGRRAPKKIMIEYLKKEVRNND
ncbi:MAG: shikimate dehydrogenase [Elusimicrobiota bacterium]